MKSIYHSFNIRIRNVKYFNDGGDPVIEKLKDMKYQHESMGWKCIGNLK